MNTPIPQIIIKAAAAVLIVLSVFLFVESLNALKSNRFIGAGIAPTNTVTVAGHGEVFAVPDTATFTYTVDETGKDVAAAQNKATQKSNSIVDYLKQNGVADTDIQTSSYNISPQYQWNSGICMNGFCPPQKRTIIGYEAMQTESVKVRDLTKAGDFIAGVGSRGASDVGALTFTVADQDAVNARARDKAIAQARAKADILAKSLGVSIARIVGFSENGSPTPVPMYGMMRAGGAAMSANAPVAPDIQAGQNKTVSDVSITYEIQ